MELQGDTISIKINKLEDNLNEDIRSFIDKHMKEKRNVRDSYLYDDSIIQKASKKTLTKSENSRRNNMIKKYDSSFSNVTAGYINLNSNKGDSIKKEEPIKSKKMSLNSFKISKTK